jgi:hypothetical protein
MKKVKEGKNTAIKWHSIHEKTKCTEEVVAAVTAAGEEGVLQPFFNAKTQ